MHSSSQTLSPFADTALLPGRAHRGADRPSISAARRPSLNRRFSERTAVFEQALGSLWEPGLLDRLTAPLTRYHE
jgi:hypothetical protein